MLIKLENTAGMKHVREAIEFQSRQRHSTILKKDSILTMLTYKILQMSLIYSHYHTNNIKIIFSHSNIQDISCNRPAVFVH